MPGKLRNILYHFDSRGITHYAGLTLFQQFCKSLGLKRFLARNVRWHRRGRTWSPSELFICHVLAVVAGVGRIENTHALKYNGALARLMGMKRFPSARAMRSFLLDTSEDTLDDLRRAHDRLRRMMFERPARLHSAVFDLDTTALRVFGRQEGAVRGYVPHYPNQRCYHVRLLTEARTRVTLDGELLRGNVRGGIGVSRMVEEATAKMPSSLARRRIRLRADAAFYDGALLKSLANTGLSYVIAARVTRPLRNRIRGLRFREFRPGWEVAECTYRPIRWPREERFVIVRRLVETLEPPVTLFTMKGYAYHVYVTDLDLRGESVWRFYCGRAAQELLIRELKNQYALGKIPTRAFLANRIYLEVLLWSYDLVAWFARLCLPERWHKASLATLRRQLWQVPGCMVRHGRRYVLRMPEQFAHQSLFDHARRRVSTIQPLP